MHEYQQKLPPNPIIHDTNGRDQIMGPKVGGQTMRATNLFYHMNTENNKIVVGFFLCYTRSVDPIMLLALVAIASVQSNLTEETK